MRRDAHAIATRLFPVKSSAPAAVRAWIATIRGGHATLYCFDKADLLVQHTSDSLLHHLLGILARACGELPKLGFLFRG